MVYKLPYAHRSAAERRAMADAYRKWAFTERQAGRLISRNGPIDSTWSQIVNGILVWDRYTGLVGAPGLLFDESEVPKRVI
jgi:hypothetical protein